MLKEKIKNILSRQYTERELDNWFNPLKIEYAASSETKNEKDEPEIHEIRDIQVIFPHSFFSKWFFINGLESFKNAVNELGVHQQHIQYKIKEQNHSLQGNFTEYLELKQNRPIWENKKLNSEEDGISFSDLIYNSKNFFPINLAREVSHGGKDIEYNPLIFHGNEGTGKTSLLIAMRNKFSERLQKDTLYLGDVEELNNFYHNSKNRRSARSTLKRCRAFLLDELQSLSDRPNMQKELALLFDMFKEQGCQIVLCSSQKISEMSWLIENLFTRLCSGICLELKEPDLDVRIKYIQNRCAALKISLTSEQIIAIAHKNPGFRPINGIILKIKAYLEFYNNKMSEEDFENILHSTAITNLNSSGHEAIIEAVAENFGFSRDEVLSAKRQQNLVMARQIAMYVCRKNLGLSYPIIGRIFGGRDHTTVLHAMKKIAHSMSTDKDMHNLVTKLLKKCNSRT